MSFIQYTITSPNMELSPLSDFITWNFKSYLTQIKDVGIKIDTINDNKLVAPNSLDFNHYQLPKIPIFKSESIPINNAKLGDNVVRIGYVKLPLADTFDREKIRVKVMYLLEDNEQTKKEIAKTNFENNIPLTKDLFSRIYEFLRNNTILIIILAISGALFLFAFKGVFGSVRR